MMRIFKRRPGANDAFDGIGMGDRVKDSLSGFSGVVIARSEFLTGCNQALVLPESDKANELKECHWFDVERLVRLHEGAVEVVQRPGGADVPLPSRATSGQKGGAA